MKKLLAILAFSFVTYSGCTPSSSTFVVYAQSLPYTLTIAWTASPDAANGYNCYLDGVKVTATPVTVLQCSFPVAVGGNHVVGVTSINNTFVPKESTTPATLAFKLQAPAAPTGITVR